MTNRDQFNRWIRRQLFPEDESEKATRFVLRAVSDSKKPGDEIYTVKVPKKPDDEWILGVLNEIESTAKGDAAGLSAPFMSYAVFAYFKDSDRPRARFTFKEEAYGDSDDDGEMGNEPPSKIGILAQQMRHNEKIMAVAMGMTTQTLNYYRQTNSRLSDAIDKMVEDRLNTVQLIEELHSQKHQRDLEVREAEHKERRNEEVFETLKSLAPVVIHKLTGKGDASESVMTRDQLSKALLESIKPEQLAELQDKLTPQQMMLIVNLFQSFKEEEERSAVKRLTDGKPPKVKVVKE